MIIFKVWRPEDLPLEPMESVRYERGVQEDRTLGGVVDSWSRLSDQELLSLRLNQLGLSLEGSSVARGISQLYRELSLKGLSFRPHFWVSDEWFCPDGIPGISVPFFLLHPRLRRLEQRYIGYVEGGDWPWMMKLLRHEAGHAIENAFNMRGWPERTSTFGSTEQPYPNSYAPRPYSRRFVRHLEDHYAQSHPDEDFAETFALWLNPESQWEQRYQGWAALEKLMTMEKLMKRVQSRSQVRKNRFRQDPIEMNKQTLGQFYRDKRRKLKLTPTRDMDANLRTVFTDGGVGLLGAGAFLKKHRQEICREVAQGMGEYQYRIGDVLNRLSRRADELGLSVDPSQKLAPVLDVVAAQALEDWERKRHHIVL